MDWRNEYVVGTSAVVVRHQRVVELLNRLHAVKLARADRPAAGAVLDELVDAAMCAFAFEDCELRAACREDAPAHRREHEELVDTLTALRYEHDVLGFGVNVRDLRFVAELFRGHLSHVSRPCESGAHCTPDSLGAAARCENELFTAEESGSVGRASMVG